MKVTIHDVALKAKVSIATVSRVVSNNDHVRKDTRLRVEKAIEELQYIPNAAARELNKKESSTIGVIVPSIGNMFFTDVISGIENDCKHHGYSLFLCVCDHDAALERKQIYDMMSRNVAGIIVVDANLQNIKENFYAEIANMVPMTFINGMIDLPNVSCISNDEMMGTITALHYLVEKQHQNILFVRGAYSRSYDIKEEAYTLFMKQRGWYREDYIMNIGEGNSLETVQYTMNKMIAMLQKEHDVTAVLACNDLMALGVMNACKKLGLRVKKDLSVIGFDNIELCQMIEPNLTTMDQNMYLLGSNASMLLQDIIQNNHFKKLLMNNILVERDTVGENQILIYPTVS
ncbi:LacI family DNA-binding transcriptional regulator [[Eubacterium] hominis]|uniref:LacI family DNA-binding transcriptional regulator n=1 Tax=[Eubacterium] hominis TaxID=2764325 RepID=UPI003A4D7561